MANAEALEPRRLLSADVDNRVLTVTGTSATDFVTFGLSGDRLEVYIGGTSQGRFRLSTFDRIQANLLGGADVLQATSLKPLSADLGAGDDASGTPDRIEITATALSDPIEASADRVRVVGSQTYDFVNCEAVFITAGEGKDELRLVPPTNPGAVGPTFLSFNGGVDDDRLDAAVPWAGSLYFDGGAGHDRLIATAATHYDFAPGDGNDSLVLPTTDESDWTSVDYTRASVHPSAGSTGPVRDVNHNGAEQIEVNLGPSGAATGAAHVLDVHQVSTALTLKVNGSPDADTVYVNPSPFGPTNARLEFNGNGGDDRLEMAEGTWLDATFDGGAGTDEFVFVSGDADDFVNISPSIVQVSFTGLAIRHANAEHAEVHGGRGNDHFNIAPSATTTFDLRAHAGSAAEPDPDDSMFVNTTGTTPTGIAYTRGTTDGRITFAAHQPITFSGVDEITGFSNAWKPTANPGGPYEVVEGKSVQLDGTASTGFEGPVITYSWDFDYDGTTFTVDAQGSRPTFSAAGLNAPLVRTVALRVVDAGNRSSNISTATVTLTPTQPPVANPNGPYEVYKNSAVTMTAAGSADPDGSVTAYQWDFDYDGVTFDVNHTSASPTIGANGLEAGHVRTVALRVRDDSGVWSPVATTTVTVKLSAPPTVSMPDPASMWVEEMGEFFLGASWTIGEGDWFSRLEWDFDYDGVTFTPEATQNPTLTSAYRTNWDGPSTRNVAARIVTNQGQTAIATGTATVRNVTRWPSVGGPATAAEGSPYTLTLNAGSDPGPDTVSAWTIDWGDGVVESVPGNPPSATHVYADGPANYSIKATAADEDGAYAAHGTIAVDAAFGTGGWTTTPAAGTNESARAVVQTPDGKTIAAGPRDGTSVVVTRYNADGTLDTTFGTGGTAARPFADPIDVYDVVLQPDGKFVVAAGAPDGGQGHLTVLRFNADGTLDQTFADGGVFLFAWAGGSSKAADVALLPGGKLLVGGNAFGRYLNNATGGTTPGTVFTLLRLNSDGTLDATFADNGISQSPFSAYAEPTTAANLAGVHVRADGSILAVGQRAYRTPTGTTAHNMAIAIYSPDGALLDVRYRPMSAGSQARVVPGSVAFAGDETFVCGLYSTSPANAIVGRFLVDAPNTYTITMEAGETLGDIVPQPDGSVLVAASYQPAPGGPSGYGVSLRRLLRNNSHDWNFNGGAWRVLLPTGGPVDLRTASQAADGRVTFGGMWRPGPGAEDFLLAKIRVDTAVGLSATNVAPAVTAQGPAAAPAGEAVDITFAATDVGDDALTSWRVDWGDGVVDTLPGGATGASHAYATGGGSKTVRVSAFDEDGGPYAAPPFVISVANPPPSLGADGVLHVWTGDAADNVELSASADGTTLTALVNGTSFDFARAAVTAIDVQTFGLADTVRIGGGVPTGSVHLGGQSTPEVLTVTGPLAGDAPLAVESFSASTFTFAPGVRASLSTHGFGVRVNLTGTDGDDAWVLHNNDLSGAGNEIAWAGGNAWVTVDALGGDDTFDVEIGMSYDGRPAYTLLGGAGDDTARLLGGAFVSGSPTSGSSGGFAFLGGDDVDTLEVAGTAAVVGAASYAGDGGDDVLVFNGRDDADDLITANFANVRRSNAAPGTVPTFTVFGINRTTNPVPWEDARVYGHGGKDILATSSPSTSPRTLLDGGAGDDQFRLGNDTSMPTLNPVEIRGGDGSDGVVVTDTFVSAGGPPRSFTLDGTGVQRDATARHTFDTVEAVTLNTSGVVDTITVTPSANTTFTVNGGFPTAAPGDTLRLRLAGVTGATLNNTSYGAGSYTFTNRQPVHFTSVEHPQSPAPPAVVGVFVGSTAWNESYRLSLAVKEPGSEAAFGYRITTADRNRPLAWSNLNQLSVRFSEHVNVAADDFVLNGVNLAAYGLAPANGFRYDPATFTATWTLDRFIPADKVTIRLDAGEGTGITDDSDQPLDGEPNQAVTHIALFPSGDGVAGGDFALPLRVLPGDLDRSGTVNVYDYNLLRANMGQSYKGVWGGDINGDDLVSVVDFNELRANLNKTAPM